MFAPTSSKSCVTCNFRVLDAHDADAALGMVDRNDVRVDLVLTDVVLPGMNGRQLAEEMKLRQPGIKVLFMSGYSRDAIVRQGRLEIRRRTDAEAADARSPCRENSCCPWQFALRRRVAMSSM